MVWGHDDFVRELHRQLVELEALRRKILESTDKPGSESSSLTNELADGGTPPVPELDISSTELSTREQLEDSLEKLENSHHQILRKIGELFSTQFEVKISGVLPANHPAAPNESSTPESIASCLQSMLQQPGALEHLVSFGSGVHFEQLTDVASSSVSEAFELANTDTSGLELDGASAVLQERCRGCGKLLVSSVLAGAQVFQESGGWIHAGCREDSTASSSCDDGDERERLWQPSALN